MNSPLKSRVVLTKNVFLYVSEICDPMTFVYEAECGCNKILNIDLRFDGSENFECGNGGLVMTAKILPFCKSIVGVLKLLDSSKRGIVKSAYSWELHDIKGNLIDTEADKEHMLQQIERIRQLGINIRIHTKEFIEDMCRRNQINFIDLNFLPVEDSIYCRGKEGFEKNWKSVPPQAIVWKRPK